MAHPSYTNPLQVRHSDAEWRRLLAPEAYAVLRQAQTERRFTSPLVNVRLLWYMVKQCMEQRHACCGPQQAARAGLPLLRPGTRPARRPQSEMPEPASSPTQAHLTHTMLLACTAFSVQEKRAGTFVCGGCGQPLFASSTKYESGQAQTGSRCSGAICCCLHAQHSCMQAQTLRPC